MTLVLRRSIGASSAGTIVEVVNDEGKGRQRILTVQARGGSPFDVSPDDVVQLRSRIDEIPARPRSKRRADKVAVEGLINKMIAGEPSEAGDTNG